MYERLTSCFEDDCTIHTSMLEEAVSDFVDQHKRFTNYREILEEADIDLSEYSTFQKLDVAKLTGTTLVALIVYAFRHDHFCEGIIGQYYEDGLIEKWLLALRRQDGERSVDKKLIEEFEKKLSSVREITFYHGPTMICTGDRDIRYVADFTGHAPTLSGIHAHKGDVLWQKKIDKRRFLADISLFNIGRWRCYYEDPDVCDGSCWYMSFTYKDLTRRRFAGLNAYPRNFRKVDEYFESFDEGGAIR